MTEFAPKGSQRWLQMAIELRPAVLDLPIKAAIGADPTVTIDWVSPRKVDGFKEYRDSEALAKVGIERLPYRPLAIFWPQRGPVWDGLGRTSSGDVILVEAKAHIAEMVSPSTRANPEAAFQIKTSLDEARRYFSPKATASWHGTFYQYANRLAHLYLIRQVNRISAHLVFVYFLNASDVAGPSSRGEWEGAIRLLHAALGLGHAAAGAHDVFVDVRSITAAAVV
jgi:hypothetical protein